jgi:integrase
VEVKAGQSWRRYRVVKSEGPEELVFQSVATGRPMRDNAVLTRHIKPVARKLGLEWVNWQVLRRSCATWMKQAGVDVKEAQGIMRHARASTTQDIYQQQVPEAQQEAVRKLTAYISQAEAVGTMQ